jgi:UDP:flavonoid glycosyltransferase YjiC (YdhE family)
VAVPHAGDQQPQAGRITQAGVGYGVQPANFTLPAARWLARQLVENAALRQAAAGWQAEMAALGGVEAAAQHIESKLGPAER